MRTIRIIDAHLHFAAEPYFDAIAKAAEHENTVAHLQGAYKRHNLVGGVVMGNTPPREVSVAYPSFLRYCLGLSENVTAQRNLTGELPFIEAHLQRPDCVGIKLYPGYSYFYVYEDFLAPLYSLAVRYKKPVAVHTGLTAGGGGLLKYAHPSVLDEAAVKFPQVQFVMCHFGEPWFTDAGAVIEKNLNVAADLSGMLEGKIPDMTDFLKRTDTYVAELKGRLAYLDMYDRFMFGTDWPLANLGDYIEFTKAIIPEEHWDKVFYENAVRIYGPIRH